MRRNLLAAPPDDLQRRGGQRLAQGHVGQMPAPRGGKAPVERDAIPGRAGRERAEAQRRRAGRHRVAARWPRAGSIQFADGFHRSAPGRLAPLADFSGGGSRHSSSPDEHNRADGGLQQISAAAAPGRGNAAPGKRPLHSRARISFIARAAGEGRTGQAAIFREPALLACPFCARKTS